jgi:hypothetical protein
MLAFGVQAGRSPDDAVCSLSHSHRRFGAVFAFPKSCEKPFKRFPCLLTLEVTGLKPRYE